MRTFRKLKFNFDIHTHSISDMNQEPDPQTMLVPGHNFISFQIQSYSSNRFGGVMNTTSGTTPTAGTNDISDRLSNSYEQCKS